MSEEQHQFLEIFGQLPARLTVEQAAWVLNCPAHDIPVLVAARLLRPLGNPPVNGIKFFAAAELLDLIKDRGWLVKVTNAVNSHWKEKNARKRRGERQARRSDGETAYPEAVNARGASAECASRTGGIAFANFS